MRPILVLIDRVTDISSEHGRQRRRRVAPDARGRDDLSVAVDVGSFRQGSGDLKVLVFKDERVSGHLRPIDVLSVLIYQVRVGGDVGSSGVEDYLVGGTSGDPKRKRHLVVVKLQIRRIHLPVTEII